MQKIKNENKKSSIENKISDKKMLKSMICILSLNPISLNF